MELQKCPSSSLSPRWLLKQNGLNLPLIGAVRCGNNAIRISTSSNWHEHLPLWWLKALLVNIYYALVSVIIIRYGQLINTMAATIHFLQHKYHVSVCLQVSEKKIAFVLSSTIIWLELVHLYTYSKPIKMAIGCCQTGMVGQARIVSVSKSAWFY